MPRWLPALPAKLSHRRWRYWLVSLTILIACSWANPHIQEWEAVKTLRYSVFQWLAEHGTQQTNQTRDVTVVQINDDVFREPAFKFLGTNPTNREALGDLMRAVASHQPLGIALDFWMPLDYGKRESPNWQSSDIGNYALIGGNAELQAQTRSLANAVRDIAGSGKEPSPGIKVVLSRSMGEGPNLGGDALALFGLCDVLNPGFAVSEDFEVTPWQHSPPPDFKLSERAANNISCAHINLNGEVDVQTIPETFDVKDRDGGNAAKLISLAMELSRLHGEGWPELGELPHFAQHLHPVTEHPGDGQSNVNLNRPTREQCAEQFRTTKFVISAYCLLNPESAPSTADAPDPISGKFVIIGANWNLGSNNSGSAVDSHMTSIGEVNGPRLHQSYAEALIGRTYYYTVGEGIYLLLDISVGLIVIILMGASLSKTRTVLRLLAIFVGLFAFEMLILMWRHSYVDMLVPFFGLALHTLIERLVEGGHHDGHHDETPPPIPAGLTGQQDS